MEIFGPSKLEKELARTVELQAEALRNLTHNEHRYRLILTKTIQKQPYFMATLSIAANQLASIVPGVIDQVTLQPVSATFIGQSFTSDTPAVATVDANGNLVGVSAGSFNLSASVVATFTDSTGNQQTQTLTGTFPGSVSAVVTADAVSLVIALGAATTQPAPAPAS